MTGYDSRADTLEHIHLVRNKIGIAAAELLQRGGDHDLSKLGPEEKPAFDRETPKLKSLTYGTPEYKASLEALGPALKHHYAHNSHHPEHYAEGIAGMDLFDLLEMICDWMASAKRNAGSGEVDLVANVERFKIDPQLASILSNTLKRWPEGPRW